MNDPTLFDYDENARLDRIVRAAVRKAQIARQARRAMAKCNEHLEAERRRKHRMEMEREMRGRH